MGEGKWEGEEGRGGERRGGERPGYYSSMIATHLSEHTDTDTRIHACMHAHTCVNTPLQAPAGQG